MYDSATIKYLSTQEKAALFKVIEEDCGRHHLRNRAIFFLAEYAALRVSEVGMIELSDINFENQEIYFKRLKGSNNTTLRILNPKVWHTLMDYIAYRKQLHIDSIYLFTSQKGNPISRKTIWDIMKRYCQLADIPKSKAHPHTLKHTRIITLANLGLDTKEVQYLAGHKNIANTEIYLQFTTTQQDALYRKIIMLEKSQGNPVLENYRH